MITGNVIDATTGEALPFVNVFISSSEGQPTNENRGTAADAAGVFSLKAKPGEFVTASFVGYQRQTAKVESENDKIVFKLTTANDLPAVAVEAKQTYFSIGVVLLLAYLNSKI